MRTLITILTFTLILGAASMVAAQPANTRIYYYSSTQHGGAGRLLQTELEAHVEVA